MQIKYSFCKCLMLSYFQTIQMPPLPEEPEDLSTQSSPVSTNQIHKFCNTQ